MGVSISWEEAVPPDITVSPFVYPAAVWMTVPF